jgi:hypothetical protein
MILDDSRRRSVKMSGALIAKLWNWRETSIYVESEGVPCDRLFLHAKRGIIKSLIYK